MRHIENEKNSSKIIILSFISITIVLVVMVIILIRELEETYEYHNTSLLNGVTTNFAHMSRLYMDSVNEQVELTATAIKVDGDFNASNALRQISSIITKDYLYFGIATKDNEVTILDVYGDKAKLSPNLIQSIIKNQDRLSCSMEGFAEHGHVHMISAPIIRQNDTLGYVFIIRGHTLLFKMLDNIMFRDDIEFFIFDENGLVINSTHETASNNPAYLKTLQNFYLRSGLNADNAKQNLLNDARKIINLNLGNEQFFASFIPIIGVNWAVGALLPAQEVQSDVNSTISIITGTLGVWFVSFVLLTGYLLHVQNRSHAAIRLKATELQDTINAIPCAIVRCLNDEHWTIVDYSDSLNKLICATPEDIKTIYNNSWYSLIHPDDREQVKNIMSNEDLEIRTAEYRLLRKNNNYIYVMDRAHSLVDDRGSYLWCVIFDIDDLKKSQVQERKIVERYKYLLEMSDNILYEYDLSSHQFCVSIQFFKKFNYPLPNVLNMEHYPINKDIIHPDDMDLFMSMHMRIKVGGTNSSALLRIKTHQGQWVWCQLSQTAWRDETEKLKAIGKIENVDKETRILHKLRDDVKRDSFTSLYNKTATAELIQRELDLDGNTRGAFCIIDIDNFKQVNSTFGHAMGDMVIKNLADGLSQIFRSDDIVGRVGGDEFIVYIKDMPNLGPLLLKIDQIQEFFRQTFEDNGVTISISSSIGVALFPQDGTNYEELYRNADKALYRSKMTKDTYSFFNHDVEN